MKQCPSTQAILDRDPELDEEWQQRPFPQEAIEASRRILNATPVEIPGLINERKIEVEEFIIVDSMRKSSKNTVGQSELSSVDEELKLQAVEAFVHSPPAELTTKQRDQLTVMKEYTIPTLEVLPEETPLAWYVKHADLFYMIGAGLLILFLLVIR